MTTALQSATLLLAADNPEGPEFGKSSPFGLLIILLLLIGTALLIWSMNSQLKKLPKSFDTDHPKPTRPSTRAPTPPVRSSLLLIPPAVLVRRLSRPRSTSPPIHSRWEEDPTFVTALKSGPDRLSVERFNREVLCR